ncbi:MAG: putative Ig domain-containing protein [Planctomycetes bacterium]|nr:putative Ig domain-containing protein [Planctomycetota bacterium]
MKPQYLGLLLLPVLLTLAACGGGDAGGGGGGSTVNFAITTTLLPDSLQGVPYSQQLLTVDGAAPVTFAWAAGFTPPAWLSLSSTGVLSGTPTAPGSHVLEVTATDAAMIHAVATRTLALNVLARPRITATALPRAIKGQIYTGQVTHNAPAALGATLALLAGTLPAGISMSGAGLFSGTTTEGGLHELEIGLFVGSTQVDAIQTDLMVYESIPYTYMEDALEPNDSTGTATQLLAGNAPPGRLTSADRFVQGQTLTLNSDQNITKPDADDYFKFNIGTVGTIKIELFFRGLVGEITASLWFYAGVPTHAVSVVATANSQGDDALLEYHNAQLSAGVGAGYYYLQVHAPLDAALGLWNRNAYSFRLSFNDLTIATSQLEANSVGGSIDVPVTGFNQGAAPAAPSWNLVSGTLPAGVNFTSAGHFVGTPADFGLRDFTVALQDSGATVQRAIKVRFFDSSAGNFWQVKGERRLYNGTSDPVLEAYGDAMVVAPHPDYPAEGAIYVLGGRTDVTIDSLRVFHTDRAGIPAAMQFKFENLNKPMIFPRRYHGAAFVQHSYGGYIYVVGGEIGAATGGHAAGDYFFGVERLQVADGAGNALSHPLASTWQSVANLPQQDSGLNIKGWAEFGLAVNDAANDVDDRLYLVGGRYQVEDSVGSGTYGMKFHNAMLMLECPASAGGAGTWYRKLDVNPYSPRRFPAVAMLNGRIYVAAGRSGTVGQTGSGAAPLATIEMIQPDPVAANPALALAGAGQFPTLSEAVYYPMFAALNGKLYIWCGWDGSAVPTGTRRLHSFEPNAGGTGGAVVRLCDADWGTGFGGGVAHDGKLWVISGIGHSAESAPLNLRYQP